MHDDLQVRKPAGWLVQEYGFFIPDHEGLIVPLPFILCMSTFLLPIPVPCFADADIYIHQRIRRKNMKENSKSLNRKIATAAICLAAIAAVLLLVWRIASPQSVAGGKQITVQVIHGDGSSKDFTLDTQEEYLGPVLVAEGVVEDNQSAYGLYILTADGETADESAQEWWKITKNGGQLNTGADSTPIADGEHYELTLTVGYDG